MTKQIKRIFSTVAIILCVSIGLALPTEVFASTIPEKEKPVYSSFDDVKGKDEEIGNIIAELTDERTETSKQFLFDNGSKMIAEYDTPIHYQNNDGNWVEYDNSLKADNSTSTADEASDDEYTNKSSDIDVKLSNKAKANNMIKVTSDDYSISWGYDDVSKSKIKIVNNNVNFYGNAKFTTLKNITSEAKYEDVYKNVDLQYFVTSTGVKENIILKSSDVQNEFNLTYKIKNLTAKQTDDYTITLYNKSNEEVYKIVAPYMTDADGNSSTQLKLELISQKGGNASVKLTADYWFIHSLGRSFPITVDPELTIRKNTILSLYNGDGGIYHSYGPFENSNSKYVIAKMKSLPELGDGEKIVSAKFNFEISNYNTLFSNENENSIIVNAHKLTSMNSMSVTYDSAIEDYDSLTYNDNQFMSFDLTKLMNDWYSNGDEPDGFVLESYDTVGSKQVTINDSGKKYPTFTIIYKDFTGMESNLSYHTFSVGENAQASVSDYLGNLVIKQNLYKGTGSRMPASITATYNSINYNKTFENGSPSGYGWQFSFNQYVREVTDINLTKVGYNYIYTDADGTDHYLKKSDSADEWYDEDGLGITLTINDSGIYIDNGSIIQTYELVENGGKLLSEKDEHNNTITYTYTDGNVTSITDGAGRVIKIMYNSKNADGNIRVSKITLPDLSYIMFTYSGTTSDKLNAIYFPWNSVSAFLYNDSDRIESVMQTNSQPYFEQKNKYSFTYNNEKVVKVTEYGSDNTEGNYLNIQYNDDNTTTFTDRQDRTVTYTFDNSGNKISVLNANGYLSSGSNGLSISSNAETFTKNYITESTEQTEIKNNGYYFKSNGDRDGVVSNGGTAVIDTSEPTEENGQVQYLGTTSIKVNNPVSSTNSAFFTGAAHQFTTTEFNGKDITFSTYVKTKNVEQIYSGGAVGAILKIKCLDSSGAVVEEVNSVGITGSEEWQRLSITANVPETTASIRVYCLIRYASGTAWFDCLQFEDGNTASDFNALQNGNFESNDYWLTNENNAISAENGIVTISGEAGAYDNAEVVEETTIPEEESQPATYYETVTETVPNDSIKTYDDYGNEIKTEQGFVTRTIKKTYAVGQPDTSNTPENSDSTVGAAPTENNYLGNKYIYQNVNVDRAGVMFNIAGETNADSVPLSNENRTYGIALNIYYKNNSVPETHYQKFNSATTHKQTVSMSVTPNNPNEEIDYVSFAFVYGNNKNTMTAYNAMLNIASTNYTDDKSLSDGSEGDNNTDSSDNENDETDENDFCINNEVISESVDKSQTYMQTSKTYDSTGNYIASETDEAGNTTSYTYDVNGNKTSVTDGEDNVVNFTYNSKNDVTSVSSGDAANTYVYENSGQLYSISHNDFQYKFNYNVFQKLVSTYIGTVAITKNTYYSNNGNLKKTFYANGDYIQYAYDKYDNVIRISGEYGTLAEFVYNKKGLVAKTIDYSSGRTTYYYYDFSGTITGEYRQTREGDLSYYLSYDSKGNKVEKTEIEGRIKTIINGTDDDGNSFVSNDGVKVSGVSDDFGRTTKLLTSRGEGNSVYLSEYEYANGKSANSTTNLVSKLTQRYGSNQILKYEYSYDGNGNIMNITQNGSVVAKYKYDELNQLSYAMDRNSGLFVDYSYDNAGNVTSVKEYGLSTTSWSPLSLKAEKAYTYGDTNWKDKMTSYNGENITYDAMGNPLSYRDGMKMTWQNGRKLTSLKTNNNTITYKYDSNGLRTQKDDKRYTTCYYYDSKNNLIGINYKTAPVLYFYYDSNGNVTSFSFNNTMYYYVKNLQGDVVKIIDQSGAEVVSYTYDAWGKILNQTDSTIYNLANFNPFKYRSYVYDNESGLYYLQSRYYDPVTGRFLNADDTTFLSYTSNVINSNLYTYCCNNPISNTDAEGSFWLTLSYNIFVNLLLSRYKLNIAYAVITVATSMYNYYYNYEYRFRGYIYHQKSGTESEIKMGFYTGSYNGCGWIATYNALRALGDNFVQPYNIISYFELWGCILNGTFGILPDSVADYFRYLGYNHVNEYYFPSSVDDIIKNHRAAIIFCFTNPTCHYFMVRYYNGMYYAYNFLSDDRTYRVWESVDASIEDIGWKYIHVTCIK